MEKDSIKYITDFDCTYQLLKDDYEESLMLYKIQLLQAFNLEEFEDEKINEKISIIYEKVKEHSKIQRLLEKNKMYSDDNLVKFMLYFRYDTFYLFHKLLYNLLSNLINEKSVEDIFNELLNL